MRSYLSITENVEMRSYVNITGFQIHVRQNFLKFCLLYMYKKWSKTPASKWKISVWISQQTREDAIYLQQLLNNYAFKLSLPLGISSEVALRRWKKEPSFEILAQWRNIQP